MHFDCTSVKRSTFGSSLLNMASFSSLIFMSMLCTAWAAQNFQSVSVCPRDDVNWQAESLKKNCQGDTPDYLCAAIENQPNKYGQICTKYGLTPASKYRLIYWPIRFQGQTMQKNKQQQKIHVVLDTKLVYSNVYNLYIMMNWLIRYF